MKKTIIGLIAIAALSGASAWAQITPTFTFNGSGTATSLDTFGSDTISATFESNFNLNDLTGSHIIWETGANVVGTSLLLEGSTLAFTAGNSSAASISADLSSFASAGQDVQVVSIIAIDASSSQERLDLYINGSLAASGLVEITGNDWTGSSLSGFGQNGGTVRNSALISSIPGNPAGSANYDGTLGVFNYFNSELTGSDLSNVLVTTIPEPSTYALIFGAIGFLYLTASRRNK